MIAQAEAQPTTNTWRELIALTKPRITSLVLFTTTGGLLLAPTRISAAKALLAIFGTTMIVAAANALNCYIERDSDRLMARTQDRPLPAGRLDPGVALIFGLMLACLSIPILSLGVNQMTGLLGTFAFASYVWLYTPLKRKSPWALEVGAIPGAIPPLLGWTAATGRIETPGLVLFGILFIWQLPHFLAISLFRQADYARAGIQVLPVVKGELVTKRRIPLQVAALVGCSLLLTPLGVTGDLYLALAGLLGAGFFIEALRGLRPDAGVAWAKRLFIGSLFYLTLLFVAIAIDAQ